MMILATTIVPATPILAFVLPALAVFASLVMVPKCTRDPNAILVAFGMVFALVLIASNVAAQIPWQLGFGLVVPGGTIFIAWTLVLGDIISETYGHAWNRVVIFSGNAINLMFALLIGLSCYFRPTEHWLNAEHYAKVLSPSLRICFISTAASIISEQLNSFINIRLKIARQGKNPTLRFFVSSLIANIIDNVIFIPLAFPDLPWQVRAQMGGSLLCVRIGMDMLATPIKKIVTDQLKQKYRLDSYQPVGNLFSWLLPGSKVVPINPSVHTVASKPMHPAREGELEH